jgi:hypothetical protein
MARYLVVAHQTAGSMELRSRVADLVRNDPDAEFVLLVPATPVGLLPALGGERRNAIEVARWRAGRARLLLENVGARVAAVRIGNYDPVVAVEEELRTGNYDAVVISTLPRGVSRWLRLELPMKVRRRFPQVQVIHVIARPESTATPPDNQSR